jgi:hypothetical protein
MEEAEAAAEGHEAKGVREWSVVSLNAIFVKNILACLRHRTFYEMD